MEKEGTITIQLDYRGEIINVEVDGKRLGKPTQKIYENPPPGYLKGIRDCSEKTRNLLETNSNHVIF